MPNYIFLFYISKMPLKMFIVNTCYSFIFYSFEKFVYYCYDNQMKWIGGYNYIQLIIEEK